MSMSKSVFLFSNFQILTKYHNIIHDQLLSENRIYSRVKKRNNLLVILDQTRKFEFNTTHKRNNTNKLPVYYHNRIRYCHKCRFEGLETLNFKYSFRNLQFVIQCQECCQIKFCIIYILIRNIECGFAIETAFSLCSVLLRGGYKKTTEIASGCSTPLLVGMKTTYICLKRVYNKFWKYWFLYTLN